MTLTVQECLTHIRHTLGGELSPNSIPAISILNQAGNHLVNMHSWKWLSRPPLHLAFQAPLSFSNGTIPPATASITIPGLTNYTVCPGCTISITISSVASDFYVTWQDGLTLGLDRAPSVPGIFGTAVGTLTLNAIPLPADLRSIVSIVPTDSLIVRFTLTDTQTLMYLRSNGMVMANFRYYGAVSYGPNFGTSYGPSVPQLDIFPTPTASQTNALLMHYIGGWTNLSDDTTYVPLPAGNWIDALYIQLVRAFARGYIEEDVSTLDQRLALIAAGPVLKDAKNRDGGVQANLGQMIGGLAQQAPVRSSVYHLDTTVGGP